MVLGTFFRSGVFEARGDVIAYEGDANNQPANLSDREFLRAQRP
jgi:hypothetical protein